VAFSFLSPVGIGGYFVKVLGFQPGKNLGSNAATHGELPCECELSGYTRKKSAMVKLPG